MPLNQQAKKRITVLEWVIGPDYHGEIGLRLECRRSLRVSLSTTMSCDSSQWETTTA